MRIIGGRFKGRRLKSVLSKTTRPTSDRVREAVFNILAKDGNGNLAFHSVLDIFAGTGALGIEALSRGARFCVFVDNTGAAVKNIESNLALLDLEGIETKVVRDDALRAVKKIKLNGVDLVFIDAPYNETELTEKVIKALGEEEFLADDTVVVVECSSRDDLKIDESFQLTDERTYGDTKILFLNKQ